MSPLLKKNKNCSNDKNLIIRYSLLAAAFAAGIMLVVFFFTGNSLLIGDSTVLRMDLYHQYGPLYAEVYERITSFDSLIYSWNSGLGGSFLGNLFNYCSSPFALLMFICGHKNMPEAIALMFLFKAAFSAASFTFYVNKSNGSPKKESIVFGLMYAFSAYFISYSWNIMWIDAMLMFPIVMLGIENIINRNKPGYYIFAMTYTMITNYYMAYMVCIFSVIYFLVYYFGRYELTSKIFRPETEKVKNITAEKPENAAEEKAQEAEAFSTAVVTEIKEENEASACEIPVAEEISLEANAEAVFEAEAEEAQENVACAETETSAEGEAFEERISDLPAVSSEAVPQQGKVRKEKKPVSERFYIFRNKRFWVTGCTFAFASFLCFCLAAFAMLPVYFCLQSSSATSGTFPTDAKQYFDIFTFIANHLPGVEITTRSSGDNVIPNVYCGLLPVILLPFYFFSDKIPGKQKVMSAVMLIACLFGFVLNYFNYIWHGFHMPNDLPYRWSFAYSFILLILAYKAFMNIKEFSNKAYVGAGFAIMVFVVLVQKFDVPNCTEKTLILTVIFTILYLCVFGMLRSPRYRKNAIAGLLFFTVILEIVVVCTSSMVMQQSKKNYTSDYEAYQSISEEVEAEEKELFYRTELSKLRARMDPCWYGYNGTSTFSSMAYEHTAKAMRKLGMFGNNINSYTYFPQTPVFNSMFSLKYVYDNNNMLSDSQYYSFVASEAPFDAYEYEYFLPLILSCDDGIKDWEWQNSNPFVVQNSLMSSATGVSDIFVPVDATDFSTENLNEQGVYTVNNSVSFTVSKSAKGSEGKATVYLTAEKAGNYYIYTGTNQNKNMTVTVKNGDEENPKYKYVNGNSSISSFILDVGYVNEGETIEVLYTVPGSADSANLTFTAVYIDDEKFREAYNTILRNGTFKMDSFKETSFSGTINVTNETPVLWTSVPYDESWKITVDGQVLEYNKYKETDGNTEIVYDGQIEKIGGGFIGIEVEPGEYTVSFEYKAKGLSTGIKLTVIGAMVLLICILWAILRKNYSKKKGLGPFFLREIEYSID